MVLLEVLSGRLDHYVSSAMLGKDCDTVDNVLLYIISLNIDSVSLTP